MELQQQDNRVTGSYPAYGGRIEGTVQARELHGHWTEGPRSGQITFVLAPDGRSFMGRFETGEWWTGGRVQADVKCVTVDPAGARQALPTFTMAGNAARSGDPNEWATAAAVMEFGNPGTTMAPGQKLAATRALFELVDQTTFQLFAIPGWRASGSRLDLELKQAGTGVILPLSLVRGTNGLWRDALRSFAAGFHDWTGSGRAQVLDATDLSGFSDATRSYEGELAAAYLNEAMDRIGQVVLLRWAVGGRQAAAAHEFRWPLRLALAFLLYHLAIPALGLPEEAKRVSTGATDVILALAVMWGGWKLIDTFSASVSRRAGAAVGTLDEIVVSLVKGGLKLMLLAGGLLFIAQALSLPYEGVLPGLGIGGLTVAFACKETLSNVFGAGILVADRPFRRGDSI